MTFGLFLEWFVKSLGLILGLTFGFAYVTLFERKLLARMQVRIGPNRAGPGGLLQLAAALGPVASRHLPVRAEMPAAMRMPVMLFALKAMLL